MTACDFLVIGSGIAGASIAYELSAHASVIVAEQEDRPGYHTSGRSAAMYIVSYGVPAVRTLTAASRSFFDSPPPGFADYPILTPRGCLTIARSDQLDRLTEEERALAKTGTSFREIGEADARDLVPALRAGAVERALYEPDSADIDVAALLQGFLRLAKARGAAFRLDGRVEALKRDDDAWRATLAGGQIVEAKTIVNAAGAWADQVAALAGLAPLGMTPKRRTAILIDPPPGVETAHWPNVLDVAEQFYFKPQSGLILASPGDETPSAPVDAAPEELDIAICVDRIQAVAELPVTRVARAWAGLRTFAPDHAPVIGYDARADGFFWCAGQGGYGMQTSPAAARLGAALALGREVPADLAERGLTTMTFSPARFGG
ncbi:MAG TPA: FAD-dependent oxidoreductase [Caulobacteraceae bacterium]